MCGLTFGWTIVVVLPTYRNVVGYKTLVFAWEPLPLPDHSRNMGLKVLSWLGLAACMALIIACFLPWAHYNDPSIPDETQRTFTGFFSYKNYYGKPGKLIIALTVVIFVFMIIPRVWAKRTNLFLAALLLAYAITCYIRFGSCYNNLCPERLSGLYLMLTSAIIVLIAAMFPKGKL